MLVPFQNSAQTITFSCTHLPAAHTSQLETPKNAVNIPTRALKHSIVLNNVRFNIIMVLIQSTQKKTMAALTFTNNKPTQSAIQKKHTLQFALLRCLTNLPISTNLNYFNNSYLPKRLMTVSLSGSYENVARQNDRIYSYSSKPTHKKKPSSHGPPSYPVLRHRPRPSYQKRLASTCLTLTEHTDLNSAERNTKTMQSTPLPTLLLRSPPPLPPPPPPPPMFTLACKLNIRF